MLTREQILAADDRKREVVEVPEWGGSVIVSEMGGHDREAWAADAYSLDGDKINVNRKNFGARLLAFCLVGDDGELVFSEPSDVEALGKKNGAVINRLFAVADRLNGITGRALEEIEKN